MARHEFHSTGLHRARRAQLLTLRSSTQGVHGHVAVPGLLLIYGRVSQMRRAREEEEMIAPVRYKLEVQAAHAPYYTPPPADYGGGMEMKMEM